MTEFLIGGAISLGVNVLSGLLTPTRFERRTVERGKQESFTQPRSSYGDYISEVYGLGRVGGILAYGTFPLIERVTEKVTKQKQGGKGGGGQVTETNEKTYTYWGNCAYILCRKITEAKEIRLNSKLVWKDGTLSPILDGKGCSVRIYDGSPTQGLDPLLQTLIGPDAIPYRNRALVVFENIPLAEFGNTYPQCNAIVRNGTPKLSEIVSQICFKSPYLSANDIDVDELDVIDVTGFQVDGEKSLGEQVAVLQRAYFFDTIDSGDKLKFQKQFRSASSVSIPSGDLAAHEGGGEKPRLYKENRTDPTELPTQYEVKYLDKNNNLLAGLTRSVPFPGGGHKNVVTIDYPGALSEAEAKTIANRNLWLDWSRAFNQEINLPLKYWNLEPGDVIEMEINSQNQQVQIKNLEAGANFQLVAKTFNYSSFIYGWEETTPATPPTDTQLPSISDTDLRVLDIPRAFDDDPIGIYAFADGDANWRNATLYVSRNNGTSYDYAGFFATRSTFGTATTVLNNASTSVTVSVPSHVELETVSLTDVNNGKNRCLIGAEILSFQTATLIGTVGPNRIYELTDLGRGLRGTYNQVNNHTSNEGFYLLSDYCLKLPGLDSDIGKTLYFKATTEGQTLNDVLPVTLTITGNALTATGVSVTDFAPRQGSGGATVNIYGGGFSNATNVAFNNVPVSSFTVVNDGQITAVIAGNTTSGRISVTSPLGTGISLSNFTIVPVPGDMTKAEYDTDADGCINPGAWQRVNVQTLTSDLVLTTNSPIRQHLTPSGADRAVILLNPPILNQYFVIINVSSGANSLLIKETTEGSTVITLGNTGDKVRRVECFYDGVEWVITEGGYY